MFYELWESFKKVYGPIISFVGVVISWLAFLYRPDDEIKLKYFIIILIFLFVVISMLLELFLKFYTKSKSYLPKVSKGMKPYGQRHSKCKALLLLENSPIFSFEQLVSVYIREEDFERLLGTGFVIAIQENFKIQVLISNDVCDDKTLWDKITNNDAAIIKHILVKPSIPKSYLEVMLNV